MDHGVQVGRGDPVIRYLPLAWCPITGVWLGLDLWSWEMVDIKG